MTPGNVIRFGGAALCVVGVLLLMATASIASALGASGGTAGAGDLTSQAFWFQLTFMRLFATALMGLGAILLWCHAHLSEALHSSLAKLLGVVLGGLALMTCAQQIAIWNSSAGWVLAGALSLMAAACAVGSANAATRQTT